MSRKSPFLPSNELLVRLGSAEFLGRKYILGTQLIQDVRREGWPHFSALVIEWCWDKEFPGIWRKDNSSSCLLPFSITASMIHCLSSISQALSAQKFQFIIAPRYSYLSVRCCIVEWPPHGVKLISVWILALTFNNLFLLGEFTPISLCFSVFTVKWIKWNLSHIDD